MTEPGAADAAAVGEALKAVAEATARLPGRRSQGRLAISSAPGFAARWLLPRLPRFTERHPGLSIDIQTSLDPVDLPKEGIDAAIRLAPGSRAMPHWTQLLEESVVPVCSPALRRKYAKLSGLQLVGKADLIHMTSSSADWSEWFSRVGAEPPATIRAGLRVDTIHMAIEAARRGFGVALGRTPLFDMEIETGHGVRLFDESVPSGLKLSARDHGCGLSEPRCQDLPAMGAGRTRHRVGAARQATAAAQDRLSRPGDGGAPAREPNSARREKIARASGRYLGPALRA